MKQLMKLFQKEKATLTLDEAAQFIKTSPEALSAFESAYKSVETKAEAQHTPSHCTKNQMHDTIVDDLVARTITYKYDGRSASVTAQDRLLGTSERITPEMIAELPKNEQPQLTGDLMKKEAIMANAYDNGQSLAPSRIPFCENGEPRFLLDGCGYGWSSLTGPGIDEPIPVSYLTDVPDDIIRAANHILDGKPAAVPIDSEGDFTVLHFMPDKPVLIERLDECIPTKTSAPVALASLLNSMRPDIYEWGVWRAMYRHDDEPTVEDNIESARALRATINRLTIMLSIRFRK